MTTNLTYHQVRRNQDVLGVFSTYEAADTAARDWSNDAHIWNNHNGSFVVGHITEDRRFAPSGFWKNGVWSGNES